MEVIQTTAEHPFYVEGVGWLDAIELEAGQLLDLHDGADAVILSVGTLAVPEGVEVHNLSVAQGRTFFVADAHGEAHAAAWVHNCEVVFFGREALGRTLRAKAINYRQTLRLLSGRNVATAAVKVNGQARVLKASNLPKSLHAEERLIAKIEKLRSKGNKVEVQAVFTDRYPCGTARANCLGKLQDAFGTIKVYFQQRGPGPFLP